MEGDHPKPFSVAAFFPYNTIYISFLLPVEITPSGYCLQGCAPFRIEFRKSILNFNSISEFKLI